MKKYYSYIIFCIFLLTQMQTRAQVPVLNSYSAAKATIFLDFDGAEVDGTIWNEHGNISAAPSGLSPASITWIHKLIADHFILFNLNITTDPAQYDRAPVQQRARIIITPDGSWYGPVTGLSAIGSFVWGDDTPGWVFINALSDNPAFIAEAATHEIGHTLGLQHQSLYDPNGNMITELSGGENNILSSGAPLMGIPFYKSSGWINGHASTGAQNMQNDTAVIAGAPNDIGYRKNPESPVSAEYTVKIESRMPGTLELSSPGSYSYRLFDISGRLLTQGTLKAGINEIRTSPGSTGIFVLQWTGESVSGSQKIML